MIGVGPGVKYSELEAMASYPTEQHVILVRQWEDLPNLDGDLLDTVCNSEYPACFTSGCSL